MLKVLGAVFALTESTFVLCHGPIPSRRADWVLAATAERVVAGQLTVALRSSDGEHSEVDLRFDEVTALTGGQSEEESFEIHYHAPSRETLDHLTGLSGKRVIAFVIDVPRNYPELYLAGDASGSVRQYSREAVQSVTSTIQENERAYDRAREELRCPRDETRTTVDSLIEEMDGTRKERREAANRLIRLGRPIVPYLICELAQRKEPLREREIAMELPDVTYERWAHFLPELKVDVLDIILSAITGTSFFPLGNGASMDDRDRTIKAWWIYAGRVLLSPQPEARIQVPQWLSPVFFRQIYIGGRTLDTEAT